MNIILFVFTHVRDTGSTVQIDALMDGVPLCLCRETLNFPYLRHAVFSQKNEALDYPFMVLSAVLLSDELVRFWGD